MIKVDKMLLANLKKIKDLHSSDATKSNKAKNKGGKKKGRKMKKKGGKKAKKKGALREARKKSLYWEINWKKSRGWILLKF